MDDLRGAIAVAEAQSPGANAYSHNDWNILSHIGTFWCSSAVDITKEALLSSCKGWFAAAGAGMRRVRFSNNKPAKRISFALLGGNAVSFPRARALHSNLRAEQGWRIFSIAGDGQSRKMFVRADEGP